jgi:hypothetical protein
MKRRKAALFEPFYAARFRLRCAQSSGRERAKTFVNLDRAGGTTCGPDYKSFFASFCSQKEVLSLS